MGDKNTVIARLDDFTVLKIFRETFEKFPSDGFYVNVIGIENQVDLKAPNAAQAAVISRVFKPGSYLIRDLGMNYPGLNIYYQRGGDPGKPSPFTDELRINWNNHPQSIPDERRIDILEALKEKLETVANSGSGATSPSDDTSNNLEMIYRSTVLKLETRFAEQIERITQWTVDQADAFEKRKLELAEETNREREALRTENESRLEDVRQKTDELEELRKKLDDRDYMHARRGIRGELRQLIKQREAKFSLTSDTKALRWPVHVVMILLLAFLGLVNAVYLSEFTKLDLSGAPVAVLVWAFAKQGLLAAAFVGTIFYYVRWMNRWFEQHAAAEFLLKQFELDIDRASWVVETAMEWRRDQKAEMPLPLLEGITRNLFSDGASAAANHTAADDLASALIGNASGVKVKLGENELSLDRKGIAGLGKVET